MKQSFPRKRPFARFVTFTLWCVVLLVVVRL